MRMVWFDHAGDIADERGFGYRMPGETTRWPSETGPFLDGTIHCTEGQGCLMGPRERAGLSGE
jgi:hypothetical protein